MYKKPKFSPPPYARILVAVVVCVAADLVLADIGDIGSLLFTSSESDCNGIVLLCALIALQIALLLILIVLPYIKLTKTLEAFKRIVMGSNKELYHSVDASDLTGLVGKLMQNEYSALIVKKQAEIDALQSQINPHFLYNTLETIRGQAVHCGAKDIAEMTKALAGIFRYSISRRGSEICLEEELNNIDSYIKIQQIRFNNKFDLQKQVDADTLDIKIPKLIIQPIVENALIHALEPKKGFGTIIIRAFRTAGKLIIIVKDDGLGMPIDKMKQLNKTFEKTDFLQEETERSVGLENVNARIKLIYGNDYGVTVISTPSIGTSVTLTLGLKLGQSTSSKLCDT